MILPHFRKLALLTFIGFFASSPTMAAEQLPEVMFILDSSGSMSENAGGKQKMAAAKEVMSKLVPQLDENVRVGLTAYGHRNPGDCQDIEVLLPPGSDDRAELLSQVNRLQPRGKTPIASAILSTASLLRTKDAETTIILVSDGIETCGGNPCEVVKQLKKTGAKFVMHVVGFDVNQAAELQLKCIAKAGDGKYFAATDGEQLLQALKVVVEEIQEKVQQFERATVVSFPSKTKLGKLRVTMPSGAEVSLANLQILKAESNAISRTVKDPKPDATYPLTAGEYRVELGFATPSYGAPVPANLGTVDIKRGETKELRLGSISFNVPKEIEDGIAVEEVLIADAGSNEVLVTVRKNGNSYYHFKPKPIVAGIYNVMFRYNVNKSGVPTTVARTVVVQPGKDTLVTLDYGFQLKKGDGVIGWELIPTASQVADAKEDGASNAGQQPAIRVRVTGSKGRLWYPYVVPKGRYDVNLFLEGAEEPLPVGEGIEIQPGQIHLFDAGL